VPAPVSQAPRWFFEAINAPVIEIPDAYHHVMLDQPIAMSTALRALLADWEPSVPRGRR